MCAGAPTAESTFTPLLPPDTKPTSHLEPRDNEVFFFAVQSVASNGLVSAFFQRGRLHQWDCGGTNAHLLRQDPIHQVRRAIPTIKHRRRTTGAKKVPTPPRNSFGNLTLDGTPDHSRLAVIMCAGHQQRILPLHQLLPRHKQPHISTSLPTKSFFARPSVARQGWSGAFSNEAEYTTGCRRHQRPTYSARIQFTRFAGNTNNQGTGGGTTAANSTNSTTNHSAIYAGMEPPTTPAWRVIMCAGAPTAASTLHQLLPPDTNQPHHLKLAANEVFFLPSSLWPATGWSARFPTRPNTPTGCRRHPPTCSARIQFTRFAGNTNISHRRRPVPTHTNSFTNITQSTIWGVPPFLA